MRPRASRPDTLQSVTVLEAVDGLAAQHGEAGVPFKELEAATRSRLSFRALTDALNALVITGAVRRVTERPARLAITNAGRKLLNTGSDLTRAEAVRGPANPSTEPAASTPVGGVGGAVRQRRNADGQETLACMGRRG
jgi:hypothetical protein